MEYVINPSVVVCKVSLDKSAYLLRGVFLGDRIFFFSLDFLNSLFVFAFRQFTLRLGEGCFGLKFWGYLLA